MHDISGVTKYRAVAPCPCVTEQCMIVDSGTAGRYIRTDDVCASWAGGFVMRRAISEAFAFLAALFFASFAAGLVGATGLNFAWPLFLAAAGLLFYLFRPWMRDVLRVPGKARR
jgi:hypothetical protein